MSGTHKLVCHADICMTHMLMSSTSSEAEEFAHTHMRGTRSKDNVLIVVGWCSVEYVGRARSTLGWGERIVVVKSDGSVLVHQRVGREPVNWWHTSFCDLLVSVQAIREDVCAVQDHRHDQCTSVA